MYHDHLLMWQKFEDQGKVAADAYHEKKQKLETEYEKALQKVKLEIKNKFDEPPKPKLKSVKGPPVDKKATKKAATKKIKKTKSESKDD